MKTEKDLLQEAACIVVQQIKAANRAYDEPFELEGAKQLAEFFNETKTEQELFEEHRLICQKNYLRLRKIALHTLTAYESLFGEDKMASAYQAELKKQDFELDSELI